MANSQRSISTLNVALAGAGRVGRALLSLWPAFARRTALQLGVQLEISVICAHHPAANLKGIKRPYGAKIISDSDDLLRDPGPEIVIELIGGSSAARRLVLGSLRLGRHVITANKLLLAKHWSELAEAAIRGRSFLYYEAAVAAGLPVIGPIRDGLASSKISGIRAILNGTTNYILTRMTTEGITYADALKSAQRLGFAEADPSLDIQGEDSAHKLSILASLASGRWLPPARITCEGINGVNVADLLFARRRLNAVVKLLAQWRQSPGGSEAAGVHPGLIALDDPLATVAEEFNAVSLETDHAGPVYFQGKGAGPVPAAAAVLSDLAHLCRALKSGAPPAFFRVASNNKEKVRGALESFDHAFYLRLWAEDRPGVLSAVTANLAGEGISIAQIYQGGMPEFPPKRGLVAIVLLTHPSSESAMRRACGPWKKPGACARLAAILRLDKSLWPLR